MFEEIINDVGVRALLTELFLPALIVFLLWFHRENNIRHEQNYKAMSVEFKEGLKAVTAELSDGRKEFHATMRDLVNKR